MPCPSCGSNSPYNTYNVQFAQVNNCNALSSDCPNGLFDIKCTFYSGPNLACTGVETNDGMEIILQKLDAAICANSGDYSTYNMHCLPDYFGEPITNQRDFVDAITGYVCENQESSIQFQTVTFPGYQDEVSDEFTAVNNPAVSSTYAGVTDTDNLITVLGKYGEAFDNLATAIDISNVTWNSCFTVVIPPTTITEGFDLLADQICQIKATIPAALPVFNNVGSCLPSPGASDTLVSTIGKIKTRLCQSPVFDINSLTWGNITQPSIVTINLQDAFQSVLTAASNTLAQLATIYSGDFVVTATDPFNPSAGLTVALATPINQDRFVAATVGDSSPGTLQAKLQAGTNVGLDYISVAGKVIISATTNVVADDTFSVVFTGVGSAGSPLSADIPISSALGNAISINSDGLFASLAPPDALNFVETSTTITAVSGNDREINVKIDTSQPNNILTYSTNGLYVPSPSVISTIVTTAPSATLTLSAPESPSNVYTISGSVRISTIAGQFLVAETDGLAAKVSQQVDNAITIESDGIYVPASAGQVNSDWTAVTGISEILNKPTAGTGISFTSNTITNTSPDQTVTLTDNGGIIIGGIYPNFTLEADFSVVAPAASSPNYIQNQNAGAQASSNFWISGSGRAESIMGVRNTASVLVGTFANTHATGNGVNIQGGSTQGSSAYALQVWDYNSSTLILAGYTDKLYVGTNLDVFGTITGSISALGSTATTFLTHTAGLIQSRTASQVRTDIGAAATLSGTTNRITKFTSASTIGDSLIYDSGTKVSINYSGVSEGSSTFNVNGTGFFGRTDTYSSGTSTAGGFVNTPTFTGTLPSSGISFSATTAEFHPTINGNTTVAEATEFGAVLGTNYISFSSTGTLTLNGGNASSCFTALTADIGTVNGTVTRSAGVAINGIYLVPGTTAVITRTNHYQLLINDSNQFSGGGNITNKYGIYQVGNADTNQFNSVLNIFPNLPVYADNTAAASLATGTLYRTATGEARIKY